MYETRIVHRKRYYGKNEDGGEDARYWIEVEELDEYLTRKGRREHYQEWRHKYDSTIERKTKDLTILLDAGAATVIIPVVKEVMMKTKKEDFTGNINQETLFKFDNEKYNIRREVHTKIVHQGGWLSYEDTPGGSSGGGGDGDTGDTTDGSGDKGKDGGIKCEVIEKWEQYERKFFLWQNEIFQLHDQGDEEDKPGYQPHYGQPGD